MILRLVRNSLPNVRYLSAEAAAAMVASPAGIGVVNTASATSADAAGNTSSATKTGGRDTLGRRLLSLVYTKRSAVIAINKWKEENRSVRKYELNRIVRELRKLKRYKHALEICEWMTIQADIKLTGGDYAVHLDLVAKVRGLNSAEKFFEDLPDPMKGQATCTALLHTYVQNKASDKAEALMDRMSGYGFLKYPLPFNHMLQLYISSGQLEKVPKMIQELKKNTNPDTITYNLWLTVCASQGDIDTAEKIFLELKKQKIDPDWVTYSLLTSMYTKSSLHEKATSSLMEMEKRISKKVRIAYSSVISLHTGLGNKDGVLRTWKKMKSTFRKMNNAEYICMISSLIKLKQLHEAELIYAEWESVSGISDPRVPNLLLAAYINKNEMQLAENFFNKHVLEKDIVPSYTTWELLTQCYVKQKELDKALDCLKKATTSVKKWDPNQNLIIEVYKITEEQGNVEGAEQLLTILRHAGHVTTEIYNLLLRTYAKAGKMPLVVAERMKKDKVDLDEETHELIHLTSKMCISDVSSCLS